MSVTRREQLDTIEAIWAEHLAVARLLQPLAGEVAAAADLITRALANGGRLLTAGNGGSAADAQHIAAELIGRFLKDRAPLRALALHGNASALTAIGNDYGFEQIFVREVQAHGRAGDVLLVISTSGNSPNILKAAATAKALGLAVIGLTGETGGDLRAACDLCVCIPSRVTPRIQEMHALIGHTLCQLVEANLS